MQRYTTPTLPLVLTGGDVTRNCKVYLSIAQGDKTLKLEVTKITPMLCGTLLEVPLSQIQTGGFCPGKVALQVNVIDASGYRAATDIKYYNLGSNILSEVIEYE